MSQARYSRNPIVQAAVYAVSTSASSTPIYTAPANSYALLNLTLSSGTALTSSNAIAVIGTTSTTGTIYYARYAGGGNTSNIPGAVDANSQLTPVSMDGMTGTINVVYVGPGQSVYLSSVVTSGAVGTAAKLVINGIEFKNG